jgi:hypothetical protein
MTKIHRSIMLHMIRRASVNCFDDGKRINGDNLVDLVGCGRSLKTSGDSGCFCMLMIEDDKIWPENLRMSNTTLKGPEVTRTI